MPKNNAHKGGRVLGTARGFLAFTKITALSMESAFIDTPWEGSDMFLLPLVISPVTVPLAIANVLLSTPILFKHCVQIGVKGGKEGLEESFKCLGYNETHPGKSLFRPRFFGGNSDRESCVKYDLEAHSTWALPAPEAA